MNAASQLSLHDSCLLLGEHHQQTDEWQVHTRVHTKYILTEAVDCTIKSNGV